MEKPDKKEAPSNIINAGLYIVEPYIIDLVPDSEKEVMIEREVFPRVVAEGKLLGFSFTGQWFSTDNQERYERAIKGWNGIR